jgi:hypothetical protein
VLFSKVYNVIFEVEEAIPPGTFTGYTQWYGEQPMTPERFLTVFMLNKFIQAGRFDGPGKYHLQVYRRWYAFYMHAHLAKFPIDATEEYIREFYEVLSNLKEKDNG